MKNKKYPYCTTSVANYLFALANVARNSPIEAAIYFQDALDKPEILFEPATQKCQEYGKPVPDIIVEFAERFNEENNRNRQEGERFFEENDIIH